MRADLETRGDQLREKERENGEKDTEIGRLLGELRNLQSQLERAQVSPRCLTFQLPWQSECQHVLINGCGGGGGVMS